MQISAKQLLEVGAHFGHRKNKWNPRMEKYIYTVRNNIHIINIEQTIELLKEAITFVQGIVRDDGKILFVGTKKQAQVAIAEEAHRCRMPYIASRWRGGLFSNFKQVSDSIAKYKDLKQNIDRYKSNKKILAKKNRMLEKFDRDLKGLTDFYELPQAVFIVDPIQEHIAVSEALLSKIPIVSLLDTDCNPDVVDYPIPANDDALRSVRLVTQIMADAILEAKDTSVNQETAVKETPEDTPASPAEEQVQEEQSGS